MLWTTRKTWWNGWKPCHSVIFVNGNREDGEKKKRGKEKLHSLKGDKDTYMEMELPKTSKQAWKHYSKKELHTTDTYGKIVFFFLKLQWRGDISRNCCYLYIHSLLFQSMINKWKSLVKGGVDLVLLSLSTSPHPTPPFYALPQLPDSSPPPTSACFGQSLRAVTWWGIKPACRYCSSFHFFNNVSCRWCPHVLPLCISRKMDFCFGFVTFHFPLLHFGLSSEVRARTLVYERKPPPIVLIVWFVVSILMRWNPSCRIFCIARIVRQWEDGGAIWREFSYWWNLSNCP